MNGLSTYRVSYIHLSVVSTLYILLFYPLSAQWKSEPSQLELAQPAFQTNSITPSPHHSLSSYSLDTPPLHYSLQNSSSASRSPLVAGLLSAAIPGLGQAYAEDWSFNWRSAAYIAAEATLWAVMLSYDHKADVQTTEFQQFADTHWDVTRYAGWIDANIGELDPLRNVNTTGVVVSIDPALAPWDRVNWTRLNEVEEGIGQRSGTGFTHRLPRRPEQQYYELIGKYAQYGGGWDDAPGFTPADLLADRLSPRFLEYSKMRGRANDLYASATTAGTLIVVNHIVSALEAAWSTTRANRAVQAKAEMRNVDRGGWNERVPHVSFAMKLW